MKKVLLTLSLVCAVFMSAATAQADSIIYNWNYTSTAFLTNMEFDNSANQGVAGTTNGTAHDFNGVSGNTSYVWGQAGGANSGLTVAGASGQIVTDGSAVAGVEVTHHNNTLAYGYKSLVSGTIFTVVELQAGNQTIVGSSALNFRFYETVNTGVHDDDIFFTTAAEINSSLGSVELDGVKYYISLYTKMQALTGDTLAFAQQYAGVSADTMLYGWTTPEGGTVEKPYELSLHVSTTPPVVPVPGAVWLMGTGLAGLAALRRRNKA